MNQQANHERFFYCTKHVEWVKINSIHDSILETAIASNRKYAQLRNLKLTYESTVSYEENMYIMVSYQRKAIRLFVMLRKCTIELYVMQYTFQKIATI